MTSESWNGCCAMSDSAGIVAERDGSVLYARVAAAAL